MRAPDDDRMEDILKDEDDMVFKHGMEIADEIRAAMETKGRTRYRAPLDESGECGYRRLDAHRPSRTSHVAANDDLECCYIGLLSESMTSVAGPRAAVPRDTSHVEIYEPNIEKSTLEDKVVELHHPAGIIGTPMSQACRGLHEEKEEIEEKNEVYDNNAYRYHPVANTFCRRSAKVRYLSACSNTAIASVVATALTTTTARTSSLPSCCHGVPSHCKLNVTASFSCADSSYGRLAQIGFTVLLSVIV
jgi:hypothetical protein